MRRPAYRRAAAIAAILAVALIIPSALPAPAQAAVATASSVESSILARVNRARENRGLRPLRLDSRLAALADDRATNLVSAGSFSHAAAGGSLSTALKTASVQAYAWGEVLAWWPGGLTSTTAAAVVSTWKKSSGHWALLMSRTMNYVAFGVAVRRSDGRVFASGLLTESRDHTAPKARIDSVSRSGTTITFKWHGYDPPLQSHWARVKDYDVWYRTDGGAWRLIRDNTTATSLRLANRGRGHKYELMVRARDRAGNVGRQSAPLGIRVP